MRSIQFKKFLWLFSLLLVISLPGCYGSTQKSRSISNLPGTTSERTSSAAAVALFRGQASAAAAIPLARASQPACLVGEWDAANLPQAITEALSGSRSGLTLRQVAGQMRYAFSADGSVKITFKGVAVTFGGELNQRPVTAKQSLDGSGTARYKILADENQLLLSDFGGQGVHITLDINDQRLVEGTLPAWQTVNSWLSGWSSTPAAPVQTSRVSVACSGDTLKILSADPSSGPDVILKRVD